MVKYTLIEAYDGEFYPRGVYNSLHQSQKIAEWLINSRRDTYMDRDDIRVWCGRFVMSLYVDERVVYRVYIDLQ